MIDETDLRILRVLQENARLTMKEVAARVHLSTTPVFERIKRMEREGTIRQYRAVVDLAKLGQGFVVFCQVRLRQLSREVALEFAEAIRQMPEVTECYNVSGGFDYLLRIHARDMACYHDLLLNRLGTLQCLSSWESIFVMDEVKHDYGGLLSMRGA